MKVKYTFFITSLMNVHMNFLKEVIKNKYNTIYYPAIKAGSGLGHVTGLIPEKGKLLWDNAGSVMELSPKFISVLVLTSGFNYVKNKQERSDIYIGREYFRSDEEYLFFVKELSYKSKEQFGVRFYCEFDIDVLTGLPSKDGVNEIRKRISQIIKNRKALDNRKV